MSEVLRYLIKKTPIGTMMRTNPEGNWIAAEDFDRVTAERDALQQDLNQRDEQIATLDLQREAHLRNSQVVERRVAVLERALKFYAEREHYHFESGNWDTVSGEPLNILWNGDEPDFIEDGSVARSALKPAEGRNPSTCTWKFGAFSWHTACGQEWMLNDGTPGQNGMHFCHSCGDRLLVEDKGDE